MGFTEEDFLQRQEQEAADGAESLPGVSVEIKGPSGTLVSVTDARGEYRFPRLPSGRYKVTAALSGFGNAESNVDLNVGASPRADFTLALGTVTETISVIGEAGLFNAIYAAGLTMDDVSPDYVVVGETRLGKKALMPYLVAFNALPKVAFAPVFVAWFGFGANSKIVMALFVAFFPVIVDTAAGLYSVDADTEMLFQAMESSRWQTLRKFKLPSALPFIFAGLKSAAVFAVVGAVVGEYLGGGKGIGELVRLNSQNMRMDRVFALIVYLGIMGLILFGAVAFAEKKLVFWHKSEMVEIRGG